MLYIFMKKIISSNVGVISKIKLHLKIDRSSVMGMFTLRKCKLLLKIEGYVRYIIVIKQLTKNSFFCNRLTSTRNY